VLNCANLLNVHDPVNSREAARIAGTTQTTINRWVKSGRLQPSIEFPGYRGARLFEREDVLRAVGRDS